MVLEQAELTGQPACGRLAGREGACLVLALRHLGDALILAAFVRSLQTSNPQLAIDVVGRPQLREVVNSGCRVRGFIEMELPIFGNHRRDLATIKKSVMALRKVRSQRYTFCINLVGDVRESVIGRLSGATWNIAPIWVSGHPFKKKMTDRGAGWFVNCGIGIPRDLVSYYDSLSFFANRLGLPDPFERSGEQTVTVEAGSRVKISLHPGASHPSRHWPVSNWKELMRRLHLRGFEMQLLGSPDEKQTLQDLYSDEIQASGMQTITGAVSDLMAAISRSSLLIGMDSLSAHAAFACSVRAVVLNGSSDPRIMTPPKAVGLSAGSLCGNFPCNYSYPCRGGEREYICCRGIEVDSVMAAVDSIFPEAYR